MPRNNVHKPPVKPIGRILHSQQFGDLEHCTGVRKPAPFDRVCDCKGFSDVSPFSVFRSSDAKDEKPFKVVYHWYNDKAKTKLTMVYGRHEHRTDEDDAYRMDIIQAHATKTAAQKAMRAFAEAAFAKVNVTQPQKTGAVCNCVGVDDVKLRLGDLVGYSSCPGIVWRIVSERRTNHDWSLKVEPALSFLVSNGTDKVKEISQRDAYSYVTLVDLVELGTRFSQLGTLIAEEAKVRSL